MLSPKCPLRSIYSKITFLRVSSVSGMTLGPGDTAVHNASAFSTPQRGQTHKSAETRAVLR